MLIVTAGIIEKDNKILIAKRRPGKCLEANWEFPGGKLEKGETNQECLKRELLEELNIITQIGDFVEESLFTCDEKTIKLMAYKATMVSGEIKLNDHDDIKWVTIKELSNYKFVKADIKIVNKLLNS